MPARKPKEVPTPIRIPADLDTHINQVADTTGLSKQDVMRLAMRIGLVDLKAAEHDLPGIVQRIAEDKGTSFTAFANAQQQQRETARKGITYPPGREGLGTGLHGLNEALPQDLDARAKAAVARSRAQMDAEAARKNSGKT